MTNIDTVVDELMSLVEHFSIALDNDSAEAELTQAIRTALLNVAATGFQEGYETGYWHGWDSEHDKGDEPWATSKTRAALESK